MCIYKFSDFKYRRKTNFKALKALIPTQSRGLSTRWMFFPWLLSNMYFYLWISHAQILIYIYGVKFWQFESICKIKPTLRSHLHVTFLWNLKKSKIFSITYDVNIYLRLLSRLYILPISCFFSRADAGLHSETSCCSYLSGFWPWGS